MNLKYFKSILLVFVLVVSVSFSLEASADNGEYRIDFGINTGGGLDGMYEATLTTAPGWNNFAVGIATTTVLSLVDTNGASGTAQMYFSNVPDCQVGGAMSGDYSGPIVNSLGYPATAVRDFYYDGNWRCPAGDAKSAITFTGLNPAYTYTVKVFGSTRTSFANLSVTVGATTSNSVFEFNNTSNVVQINGATTTATSSITVNIGRQSGSEPYHVNVVELIANTGNAAPVVNAGSDAIVTATGTSTTITLSGTATDADGSIATTTWEMYSGPGGTITSSSSLTTTVTGLHPGRYAFRLYATDNFGKKIMDEKIVTIRSSDYVATRAAKKIVAVGDSITFGWGSTPITTDAAVLNVNTWVSMYDAYVKTFNASSSVLNYGDPGWTTTQNAVTSGANCVIPSGIVPGCSIGQAVAQAPDAILINSSTNDPFNGISTSTTVANIASMVAYASSSGIPVWIETPTPRPGATVNQQWMRNYILTTYPTKAIDFFTPMSDGSGNISAPLFTSDTIHPNNSGYNVLYKQVVASRLYEILTSSTSTAPVPTVTSGDTQTTISWSYPSNDGNAAITSYKVYNGVTNILLATTSSAVLSSTFTGLTSGTTYSYYVTAVNTMGESASSTVVSVTTTSPASAPAWSPGSSSDGSSGIPTSLLPFMNQPVVPVVQPITGGSLPVITSASFARSLTQGAKGDDVKKLQQYLNSKGFVIAASGVGSKGKETNLFGPATKSALIKFQKANKIPATGFFGPLTKAAIK